MAETFGTPPEKTTRIRAPCEGCRVAKRKCDLGKPRCLRCTKRNEPCTPSRSARWRNRTVTPSSKPTADCGNPTLNAGVQYPAAVTPVSLLLDCEVAPQSDLETVQQLLDVNYLMTADELDACISSTDNMMIYGDFYTDESFFNAGTSVSNELTESIGSDMIPRHLMGFDVSGDGMIMSTLWGDFLGKIVSGITVGGAQPNNPVVKFLTTTGPDEPPLFSAIMFWSHSVRSALDSRKRNTAPFSLQTIDTEVMGQAMEQMALDFADGPTSPMTTRSHNHPQHQTVLLAVLFTLCAAYIAQGDKEKLLIHLEHGLIIVQNEFLSDQADSPTFLFLAKWFGYVHTMAMLSERNYNVTAPDVLSMAIDVQPSFELLTYAETTGDYNSNLTITAYADTFYATIDSFTGISRITTAILYRIGRLMRFRDTVPIGTGRSEWLWRDFEADIDELEIRFHSLRLSLEKDRKKNRALSDLERYNYALIHTAHLIFLSRLKDRSIDSVEVTNAVELILESCAGVPGDSMTGKLMVLPLYVAGLRSTKTLHREFVRNRLERIYNDNCVTDVGRILNTLEQVWKKLPASSNDHVDTNSTLRVLEDGSVCALF